MSLALLDGDIIAFRAAAAVSKQFDFGDGKTERPSDAPAAIQAALETVTAWQGLSRCKDLYVCFTGPHNFRKAVLPTYKAHRTQGKPPDYWDVVQAVTERFPTRVVDGLEADDLMGILATTPKNVDKSVVVTIDKDLRTVPGRHLNPTKETSPKVVLLKDADYFWLTQVLTGDSTDGYVGLKGIGPKKADKILGGNPNSTLLALWGKIVAAYRDAGQTEDDALVQARVARILRNDDYDRLTKEVILWHPTSSPRLCLSSLFTTTEATPSREPEAPPEP
jgi:DNA polymerase-1